MTNVKRNEKQGGEEQTKKKQSPVTQTSTPYPSMPLQPHPPAIDVYVKMRLDKVFEKYNSVEKLFEELEALAMERFKMSEMERFKISEMLLLESREEEKIAEDEGEHQNEEHDFQVEGEAANQGKQVLGGVKKQDPAFLIEQYSQKLSVFMNDVESEDDDTIKEIDKLFEELNAIIEERYESLEKRFDELEALAVEHFKISEMLLLTSREEEKIAKDEVLVDVKELWSRKFSVFLKQLNLEKNRTGGNLTKK